MKVTVQVSPEELCEMGLDAQELKEQVIEDLEFGYCYSGYNVEVLISSSSSGE